MNEISELNELNNNILANPYMEDDFIDLMSNLDNLNINDEYNIQIYNNTIIHFDYNEENDIDDMNDIDSNDYEFSWSISDID